MRPGLAEVLKGKKAIGVIDRSLCFGWNCGPLYMETRALTPEIGPVPMLSFICGLANTDVNPYQIDRMIEAVREASTGKVCQETRWIAMED